MNKHNSSLMTSPLPTDATNAKTNQATDSSKPLEEKGIGALVHTIEVGNQLGEGVQWDEKSQLIWWTDIQACKIFSFCLTTKKLNIYDMPYRVGCFSLVASSNDTTSELIVAFDRGIAFYHLITKKLTWLHQPEKLNLGNRFNDGTVDSQGRFWAGTMVENSKISSKSAALYCIDQQQQCHKMLNNIGISNGLCFSHSDNVVYHADSPKQTIYRYQFDAHKMSLFDKTTFATTSATALPDGSTVDAKNNLWNAQWGGHQVVCYNSQGVIEHSLPLPVSQPTSVAFGGKNLDLLIVTSAKEGLSPTQLKQQPQAGHVFIYQLIGIKGVAKIRYQKASA